MKPRPVTDEDVAAFCETQPESVKRTFEGPEDLPNVESCEAVVHRSNDGVTAVVRVPMQLEDDDLAMLVAGGEVWVSMWGGLAPFAVEVVPPPVQQPKLHVVTAKGPHSRACGARPHSHGSACSSNCPTCKGIGA